MMRVGSIASARASSSGRAAMTTRSLSRSLALRGISDDVYDTLKRSAARNHRSLNREVLARLEASLRPVGNSVPELLARVEARAARLSIPHLDGGLLDDLKRDGRE